MPYNILPLHENPSTYILYSVAREDGIPVVALWPFRNFTDAQEAHRALDRGEAVEDVRARYDLRFDTGFDESLVSGPPVWPPSNEKEGEKNGTAP